MELETGESSFDIIKIPSDVYIATLVGEDEYQRNNDGIMENRVMLKFEVEYKDGSETKKTELVYNCPIPKIMTPNTKLGGVFSLLGLKDFTPHAKIDTSVFYGKKCRIVVKDNEYTSNGKKVESSTITDLMPL